ncbi:unnamed protein product [Amoebophrya sp. A25]|nr:unnamed protein product [Amoebophrya sp. A25]|eukprot:GSA25T00024672001.1
MGNQIWVMEKELVFDGKFHTVGTPRDFLDIAVIRDSFMYLLPDVNTGAHRIENLPPGGYVYQPAPTDQVVNEPGSAQVVGAPSSGAESGGAESNARIEFEPTTGDGEAWRPLDSFQIVAQKGGYPLYQIVDVAVTDTGFRYRTVICRQLVDHDETSGEDPLVHTRFLLEYSTDYSCEYLGETNQTRTHRRVFNFRQSAETGVGKWFPIYHQMKYALIVEENIKWKQLCELLAKKKRSRVEGENTAVDTSAGGTGAGSTQPLSESGLSAPPPIVLPAGVTIQQEMASLGGENEERGQLIRI